MQAFKDQLGNTIKLGEVPKRIISIVPSQTEFLWNIGVHNELVGITKFCVHPNKLKKNILLVGGTKKLNIQKIRSLKPDLIIGNKEENEKADIVLLQQEFNVWMSDIYNFEDAFDMMLRLGKIVDKEKKSMELVSQLKNNLVELKNTFKHQTVAYFIWNKPYMLAANSTFINSVLSYIGFRNVCSNLERYPQLSNEQLQQLEPDFCFLSSEPFPFKEKHVKELQQLLPKTNICIVDGELFSWYGSRLVHLNTYIKKLKKQINA